MTVTQVGQFIIQLKPSYYTITSVVKNQRVWIYDTRALTYVYNDISLLKDVISINYHLNRVTRADYVTKVSTMTIPAVLEDRTTIIYTVYHVFYIS